MTDHSIATRPAVRKTKRRPRTHTPRPLPDIATLPPYAALTRRQVCAATGFALQTMKAWAMQGRGPRITFIEKRPRYLVVDVREWLGLDAAKSA